MRQRAAPDRSGKLPALAVGLLLSLITGCDLLGLEGAGETRLVTSSDRYEIRRSGDALVTTIPITFYNETGDQVYINRCKTPSSPVLEKKIDGAWTSVYANIDLLCLGEPVVIEDGNSLDYDFQIRGSTRPHAAPKLDVDRVDGTYRVTWRIYTQKNEDEPATDLLPLEARASNEFALDLAE